MSVTNRLPQPLQRLLPQLDASPLRARLTRGAFWAVLNTLISRSLNLGGAIVTARVLGKELFGQLGVIQGTVGMFGLFAAAGMSLTATRYVAELRVTDPERAGRIIQLSALVATVSAAVFSLAVIIAAPWIAERTLAAPQMTNLLRIGVGILLFSAINGAKAGTLAGFEAFRTIATIDTLSGAANVTLSVVGVIFLDVPGALLGTIAGMGLQSIGYSIAIRQLAREHNIPLHYRNLRREWPVLWSFSVPSLLSASSAALVNWLASAVMVHQPGGYAEMGVFNAANQWRAAILFLPSTLGASMLPILSSLVGTKEKRNYFRLLWISVALNGGLALLTALAISIASPFIMRSYGAEFSTGRIVLILLSLTAALTAVAGVVGQTIISAGRMWWGFVLNCAWALVFFAAVWLLRTRGAYGLALANLIAYGVHLLTCGYIAYVIRSVIF